MSWLGYNAVEVSSQGRCIISFAPDYTDLSLKGLLCIISFAPDYTDLTLKGLFS